MLVFDFSPGPRRVFSRPLEVVRATRLSEVEGALRAVQAAVNGGRYAAGYIAYEAAPALDSALRTHPPGPLPLVWFGLYSAPHLEVSPRETLPLESPAIAPGELSWALDTSPEAYGRAIDTVRGAIADGVTYQANYTLRLQGRFSGDALGFYETLRQAHRPPYASYLDTGEARIVSLSPELFFHARGQRVVTRPMKGTAARGRTLDEDELLKGRLLASPKERAENVMIVDLLRNDLGKLARPGTVRVPELLTLETYPTFHALTSTIAAELSEKPTLLRLLRALFPCGSVTGAPKVSTMRLLRGLEKTPRGVYCGALGYLTPAGEMTFSVPIRTLVIGGRGEDSRDGSAEYGVGSGVTWDSRAGAEYDELKIKATAVTTPRPTFDLLETLLWDGGRYTLLERHLARAEASARYFGISLASGDLRRGLQEHAEAFSGQKRRVRARVSHSGDVRVESASYTLPPERPRVALAHTPVCSRDPFLYHKTTHRARYAAHRQRVPDAFDVLLWNERGELSEFTIGNLVLELDGVRVTPPREAGLLVGTFCAELLATGQVVARTLYRSDLERATRVWLVNSVHGWVETHPEVAQPLA